MPEVKVMGCIAMVVRSFSRGYFFGILAKSKVVVVGFLAGGGRVANAACASFQTLFSAALWSLSDTT
jgi:hypothetical protein